MNNMKKKMFESYAETESMELLHLDEAKVLFKEYREKEVIIEGNFEDEKWLFSDEYSHVGIHFVFDKLLYKRYYEKLFGLKLETFINCVKVFCISLIGKYVLHTLSSIINEIKRMISTDPEELYEITYTLKISNGVPCIDFFSMLPAYWSEYERERFIDCIEIIVEQNQTDKLNSKRTLAQFDSYLLFNDILNDFWKSDMSKEERLFYYPIYLWWQITSVLPLRPREFILTSRNCLTKREDGTYFLRLRRNNLKGGKKEVTYKINHDYYETTYNVPDRLGKDIEKYLEFTKEYDDTQLETLFVTDTHYQKWNRRHTDNNRYFTYENLNCVLRYFYHEIIEEKYGLNITVGKRYGHLKENEIMYIHLGDTRHIALINIMLEGGTPMIAMQLAGHDSIDISAHYYSNITNLIECRTYKQYRHVLQGEVSYEISKFNQVEISLKKENVVLSDGGKCFSENFRNGDIQDCMNAVDKNGEIGCCKACVFYQAKKRRNFQSRSEVYKQKIKEDCIQLENIVNLVRMGRSDAEDIGSALLKLQSSSLTYQQYYDKKIREERG